MRRARLQKSYDGAAIDKEMRRLRRAFTPDRPALLWVWSASLHEMARSIC
jgi:hypothetical protein